LENCSVLEQLRQSPQFSEKLAGLTDTELHGLAYDWATWARPNQLAPPEFASGEKSTWLILAGRGYGKTRVGAEQVRAWIKEGFNRVNFIAPTADDIRDVMVEGESGILAVCPPDERPVYRVSKRRLEWPNGSISLLFTAEEPERLRGKQHQKLWTDEPASWRYDEDSWDQAMFGLRIGREPQVIATTTPRPTKLIRALIKEVTTIITRGTTYENRSNLAQGFYSRIIKKYEGTRLGRQELMAEVLDDNLGALFHLKDIEGGRVQKLPPLVRVVVALDPAVTSNEDSDEWGIVAAGMDGRDPAHFYTLADESEIYSPDDAAKQAVRLFQRLAADRVIGEANNGGDMIEALLRNQETNVPYRKVTASRGKVIRAEPVAALYEQGRVHHHGMFAKLEDEMTNWNPQTDDDSPNRMDALVWAITELAAGTDGWIGYARSEVAAMEEKGIVVRTEERINVAGENRDICECGSTFWLTIGGEERCLKCQAPRPK
jgi:phage terminase large subunit-like protein